MTAAEIKIKIEVNEILIRGYERDIRAQQDRIDALKKENRELKNKTR